MNIPQDLNNDVMELKRRGYKIEMIDFGGSEINVIIKNFALPKDMYNLEKTDIVIVASKNYPISHLDMFWVDSSLKLKNGTTIQKTTPSQKVISQDGQAVPMLQVSIHPYSDIPWVPGEDTIITYFAYIEKILKNGGKYN